MAKVYENKKGFKIIQATRGEMICALSEYGCVGICFHKWYARAKCYASDEYVENKNFELYKAVLGIY